MKTCSAVFAACGLACSVSAQVRATRIDVQVSDDGLNWSDRVVLPHADPGVAREVQFRLAATLGNLIDGEFIADPQGTVAGFASLTCQPVVRYARAGDTILPFANAGNNGNGGSVADVAGLPSPYGRIRPFASTGPSGTQRYAEHRQVFSAINYLRIARNDVTRWCGEGPTTGTGAVNNFNGACGVACSQKSPGNVSGTDPAFQAGNIAVVFAKFGLSVAPATVTDWELIVDVPLGGVTRNATTNTREASWFLPTGDNSGSVKGPLVVFPAIIHVQGPPVVCIADFNADGAVDGSDVGAFFDDWERAAPSADVNRDGGVDGGDVQAFFIEWETGSC